MPKTRLDVLLTERGLAESRAKAQALIMAGQVRVNDQVALKPATAVDSKSALTVDTGPRFVSRGGEKLDAALEAFALDVKGLVCADVAPRPAASPIVCFSAARRRFTPSMWAKASCTGNSATTRAWW